MYMKKVKGNGSGEREGHLSASAVMKNEPKHAMGNDVAPGRRVLSEYKVLTETHRLILIRHQLTHDHN